MSILFNHFYKLFFITGFFLLQTADAQMNSNIEKSYIGGYTKNDFETMSRLVLLDDRTFMFSFMGGSLDLVAVGYWEPNASPEPGIQLKEVRLTSQVFPAYIEKTYADKKIVKFIFDGYSMSNASRPVFAVSKTEIAPSHFRPLFDEDQYNWREEYELPVFEADDVKYFYLGYTPVDEYQTALKLKVFQYKLDQASQLKIGFNAMAVNPLMNMTALLEGDTLIVDGKTFGTKDILPPEVFDEIRYTFINPILKPAQDNDESIIHGNKLTQGQELIAEKEIELQLSAITGEPYQFVAEDPLAFKYQEWYFLDSEYENVMENNGPVLAFLKVTGGLVQHQTVEYENARTLVAHYNDILNKNNNNKENQFLIIEYFLKNIEPALKSFRIEKNFNKSFEIFISNSLGTALVYNNDALKEKIYNALGENFDIKKLVHNTLLYNIACDYSRRREKQKMLEAINLAIEKGKPPENFLKDSDFKFYYDDADFLKLLSVK